MAIEPPMKGTIINPDSSVCAILFDEGGGVADATTETEARVGKIGPWYFDVIIIVCCRSSGRIVVGLNDCLKTRIWTVLCQFSEVRTRDTFVLSDSPSSSFWTLTCYG